MKNNLMMSAAICVLVSVTACGGTETRNPQHFAFALGQQSLVVLAHGDWAKGNVVYELSYDDGVQMYEARVDGSPAGAKRANAFSKSMEAAFRAEAVVQAGESSNAANTHDIQFKQRLIRVLSGSLAGSRGEATDSRTSALKFGSFGTVTNSCYDHYLMCKTYDSLTKCLDRYVTCKETGKWPSFQMKMSFWRF